VAITFDPSTDFEDIADGLEAVTLNRRGSSSNVSITNALQRALTTREIEASDGKYRAGDVRWHLPEAETTTAPSLGDVIVDASSNRWTILDKQHATLENRWRLICRDVGISYGLDDTVDILRNVYTKGTSGADEPTAKVYRAGVRARIQPVDTEIDVEHAARRRVQTFAIFLGEDLDIKPKYQVRHEGTIYKVTRYEGAERIGQLSTITAEETPWPRS